MEEMKIKWVDLKMSQSQQDFYKYQRYLYEIMCECYGVPKCLIKPPYKETWIEKLERKLESFMYFLTHNPK